MIIKNFDQLASTPLRKTALEIIETGFEAIQTDNVIRQYISLQGNTLTIKNKSFDLTSFDHIYVAAFGKSSYLAAKTLEEILGDYITQGIAIGVTHGEPLKHIKTVVGTHPAPSKINEETAREIIELLKKSTNKDLVIAVVSGGGSALLAAPYKMNVETQSKITTALMDGGANIHELNIVRKHISDIKGGRFAALVHPAKLITLIFSDVPGNDLSTIASGPTVMDQSTMEDAQKILEKYTIREKTGIASIELSESPKNPVMFEQVDNLLILDPESAVRVMEEKAKSLGWSAKILSTTLEGEAREVGKKLLHESQPNEALIAAGETTVNVKGDGVGGRNQELVLANLENIQNGQVIIAAASDGQDHSDSAGAIADHNSLQKANEMGLNPQKYLDNSDSFHFFQELGDSLQTGTLGSNIADMFLVLYEK